MEIAIIAGTRFRAFKLSRVVNKSGSGPSAPTINGAGVPGTYCAGTYTATRRVYGAGWLVVTINLAGSFGSGRPKVFCVRAMPGYILLSAELIVNWYTVPCGTLVSTVISSAGSCVGPMIKFPLASAGGTAPSGNSVAVT